MVYTAKIEMRISHSHAPALLHNYEALGECEALETLTTELYIVINLPISGLFKKERREGSYIRFNLLTNMGRAVRLGGLNSGHYKRAISGKM